MKEVLKVEVHDSEILCMEYSKPETGLCACGAVLGVRYKRKAESLA